MNSRERFHAVLHYLSADRRFRWEMGPYAETLRRWQREGMAEDTTPAHVIGYDRIESAPVRHELCPAFEKQTIEETPDYVTYRDNADGVIKKIRKDAEPPAMPQYVRFPIESRSDWREFRRRLNPDSPARFPAHWESLKKQWENRDFPLGIGAGSLFGWLRNWAGLERITTLLYDDRAFVEEMMEDVCNLLVAVLTRACGEVRFDYASMWEDMAYKTASLISPRHVRELMLPRYKRITEVLHTHGIEIILLDSDGQVEELIPIWLECGINLIYPMECAAGMDVVRLRRKFGRNLLMAGGMDKRILARDKRAIRDMVTGKKALLREGGYIPGCDHAIPPDIPWENFLYYHRLVDELSS